MKLLIQVHFLLEVALIVTPSYVIISEEIHPMNDGLPNDVSSWDDVFTLVFGSGHYDMVHRSGDDTGNDVQVHAFDVDGNTVKNNNNSSTLHETANDAPSYRLDTVDTFFS